jgi:predicted PurR-regulated permease PerM
MPNLPTVPALQPSQVRGELVTPLKLDIVKIAAALVTAAILFAGLYYGRDVLKPLAIAFLITFA